MVRVNVSMKALAVAKPQRRAVWVTDAPSAR